MGSEETRRSYRVHSQRERRECGRYFARRDENRDGIRRRECGCLVVCGWQVAADWEGGDFDVVKFSPDGRLFVANYNDLGKNSGFGLQIVDSQDVKLLRRIPIAAKSVAWTNDSKQLLALSFDGRIYCLDAYSQATPSKWRIHSGIPESISLSSNGKFMATSASSSVSFWDTSSHMQIGFVIHHSGSVHYMGVSSNYDLVLVESSTITLRDLRNVLSAPYVDDQVGGSFFPPLAPSQSPQ